MQKQIQVIKIEPNKILTESVSNTSILAVEIPKLAVLCDTLLNTTPIPIKVSKYPVNIEDPIEVSNYIATQLIPNIQIDTTQEPDTRLLITLVNPSVIAQQMIESCADLDSIIHNLSELLIKFNSDPKVYLKKDYQLLLVFISSILSYLLQNTGENVNDVENKYATIKIVKEALNLAKSYTDLESLLIDQKLSAISENTDLKFNQYEIRNDLNISAVENKINSNIVDLLNTISSTILQNDSKYQYTFNTIKLKIDLLELELNLLVLSLLLIINNLYAIISAERKSELNAIKKQLELDIYNASIKHFDSYNQVLEYWKKTHVFKVPDIISIKNINYEFYYLPDNNQLLDIIQDLYLRKLGNQTQGTIEENLPIFYIDDNGYLMMEQQKFGLFTFGVNEITGQLYVEI